MQIRTLLALFLISISLTAFANIDSTGVQNDKGKKIIIHKVEPKETYYSLARKYGVTPKSIMDYNDNKALQPGMVINVPTNRPFTTESTAKKVAAAAEAKTIKYKVRPKETLYSISQKFNTTVAELRELNDIKGDNLSIGQIIKVREGGSEKPELPAAVPKAEQIPVKAETPSSPVNTALAGEEIKEAPDTKEEVSPKTGMNRYGLREHNERGVAIWIDDESVDGSKLLVLHRTAPVGTVMKITNPMTDKSTFAKVVGKFTENESTKDVIIVLTKAVADLIGAMDKRFQVSIDYGLNE